MDDPWWRKHIYTILFVGYNVLALCVVRLDRTFVDEATGPGLPAFYRQFDRTMRKAPDKYYPDRPELDEVPVMPWAHKDYLDGDGGGSGGHSSGKGGQFIVIHSDHTMSSLLDGRVQFEIRFGSLDYHFFVAQVF